MALGGTHRARVDYALLKTVEELGMGERATEGVIELACLL